MDKKEHIILQAIELFSKWGYDNTSIRELSQKAGVNVAMINYYFGSKEKLFESIIEYKSHYLKARLKELRENKDLGEMEKINVIITEYVTRILANPHFHRILHQELLLKTRPEVNATIKQLFSENFQIIGGILEDGKKKKLFRNVDTNLTISTLFGTINHCIQTTGILHSKEQQNNDDADDSIRERLIAHLQQLMQSHLLKAQNKK